MARKAFPWWWAERSLWMVNIGGKRHTLGPHPEDSPKPKKGKNGLWNVPSVIEDEFQKLKGIKAPAGDKSEYVATVLQAFLKWSKENNAPRTYDRYWDFLDAFERRWHGLTMGQLKASHVQEWLNEQVKTEERRGWTGTTKRNAITALMRAFNWAVKNYGLDRNPIKGMEKPEANRRTTVVSPEEFKRLLAEVHDEPFRDLLIVSYDSGARPQEVKRLEARHLELTKQRAVLPREEAKGKRIARVIYFPTPRSLKIIKRLAKAHPTGALLLNNKGNPWTGYAVKLRFERLEKKTGKRFFHYAMRHSRITEWLKSGVDSHVAAALSGHRDTKMIDTVYSHIADDHEFMLNEAQRTK